ncbi:MAG TPA: histidine phosphatase family protein [Chitinophagaceae bacterium]|nr:histidine phosphatase family protein [Chitinophagaceae bacterium]
MKTLIVVRHAKSSWDNFGQEDSERPLNDRGKRDAPAMAKRLKGKIKDIDLFVSSPAKRAKRTARYFAEEFKVEKDDIVIKEKLYETSVPTFYSVVESLPDKKDIVALFSHNPGITDFVNALTTMHVDNMPTTGVFAVQINTDKWADFKESKKTFLFFDYPKNVEGAD